jgi:hypothetical protein
MFMVQKVLPIALGALGRIIQTVLLLSGAHLWCKKFYKSPIALGALGRIIQTVLLLSGAHLWRKIFMKYAPGSPILHLLRLPCQ